MVILPVVLESVMELVNNFQWYWNTAIEKLNALPEDSILKSQQAEDVIKNVGRGNSKYRLKTIYKY